MRLSWVVLTSSTSQEILCILCNTNVHYRVHNIPLRVSILREVKPVHALPHYLLTSSMVQSPSWEANSSQLVKKFPPFYGTRRFIAAFTSSRHLSLSWASSIQSMPPHPTSWRYILLLSSHLSLGLLSDLFPQVSLPKSWIHLYSPPYVLHAPPTTSVPYNWILSSHLCLGLPSGLLP